MATVALLATCALQPITASVEEEGTLQARFASPPNDRRMLQIIHNFPKDPSRHEALLRGLLARGFGGVVCNVHFDDYLRSEDNWASFAHGVRMAKELGMALWVYDEQGYPSGNAGGLTLEGHPELRARGLLVAQADTDGAPVDLTLPPGDLHSVAAYPVTGERIDLDGAVDLAGAAAEGHLRWRPDRPGKWRVVAFVEYFIYEGTHATSNVHKHQPYINLLEPEATERFLSLTHDEYARRLPTLSHDFVATFTDEPSLMSLFFQRQPWAPLPWTRGMEEAFESAKGYALRPKLAALVTDAGAESHRVRCDFWDFVAQRVATSFFLPIRKRCHSYGLRSGGHLLAEESLVDHVALYGDFFRCAELLDCPSIDCLTSLPPQVPWHIAKLLGSIGHANGAREIMSETSDHVQRYRPPGDSRPRQSVTAADIRGTCNLLYVAGVNTTTSYYSWDDLTTEEQVQLNDYLGRCGVALTGGVPIADIAVIYPVESVWPHMVPATQGATDSPAARRVDGLWREVQTCLFAAQRDFEMVSCSQTASGTVDSGALGIGPMRFRVVVVPAMDTMPLATLRQLMRFRDSGGTLIFVGNLPVSSLERPNDPETAKLVTSSFGPVGMDQVATDETVVIAERPGAGAAIWVPAKLIPDLPRVLNGTLTPDLAAPEGAPIRYAHRRIEGRDVYFVVNDSPAPVTAEVVFRASEAAEVWDPMTGAISPAEARAVGEGRSALTLSLAEYSGQFVVFGSGAEPGRPLS